MTMATSQYAEQPSELGGAPWQFAQAGFEDRVRSEAARSLPVCVNGGALAGLCAAPGSAVLWLRPRIAGMGTVDALVMAARRGAGVQSHEAWNLHRRLLQSG
jgi:hypothetical protein